MPILSSRNRFGKKWKKRRYFAAPPNPGNIGDAVAYLASDRAEYMTGTIMNLLGGLDLFVL